MVLCRFICLRTPLDIGPGTMYPPLRRAVVGASTTPPVIGTKATGLRHSRQFTRREKDTEDIGWENAQRRRLRMNSSEEEESSGAGVRRCWRRESW